MKKYIITIYDWCVFFVQGSFDELEQVLNSIGVTICDCQECCYENLGVLFDKQIYTKTYCCGNNNEATQKALSDIKEYFCSSFDRKTANRLMQLEGFESAVQHYFKQIPFYSNVVKIYAESDNKYQPKPNECIFPRKYDPINSIDKKDFWEYMWRFAGQHEAVE